MSQILRLNEIQRVAFVDKGDNPTAEVVIHKRLHPEDHDEELEKRIVERDGQFCVVSDDGSETLGCHDTESEALEQLRAVEANKAKDSDMDEESLFRKFLRFLKNEDVEMSDTDQNTDGFDVEKLDDEAREAFDELNDELEKAQARIDELEAADADPDADEGVAKADLPDEVRKALEDAESRASEAEERIEKLEMEKRRERFITKAASFDNLPGVTGDDFGEILMKIDEALTEDEFDAFEKVLRGADNAIEEGSRGQDRRDPQVEPRPAGRTGACPGLGGLPRPLRALPERPRRARPQPIRENDHGF